MVIVAFTTPQSRRRHFPLWDWDCVTCVLQWALFRFSDTWQLPYENERIKIRLHQWSNITAPTPLLHPHPQPPPPSTLPEVDALIFQPSSNRLWAGVERLWRRVEPISKCFIYTERLSPKVFKETRIKLCGRSKYPNQPKKNVRIQSREKKKIGKWKTVFPTCCTRCLSKCQVRHVAEVVLLCLHVDSLFFYFLIMLHHWFTRRWPMWLHLR